MVFGPMRQILPQTVLLSAMMVFSASSSQAESITDFLARAMSLNSSPSTADVEKKRTRFRIGLDKHVKFQVFSLARPNRVVVELPNIKLKLPDPITGEPVGLVKAFRAGKSAPGQSRIVIEVTEAVVVDKASIEKSADGRGHELALEFIPVAPTPRKSAKKRNMPRPTYGLGAMGLQPPLPARAQSPSVMAAKSYKHVIVIDPGHGGHDTGAKKNGTVEKEVVLAFGRALRDKLEATGRYKVLMTRDRDVFIELSERVNYAERNKADLFMAIHADYARSKANGATVYSLRDSLANRLKRRTRRKASSNLLSRSELAKVKKARGNVSVVKGFLSDLAKREVDATKDRTKLFSKSIVNFMGQSTTMRLKPHKSAGFRVLKTQKFPSVLIELAYVTNKKDAAKLKSDQWRDKVANSLTQAVDSYFTEQIALFPM